jgi:hypothetical protein
MTLPLYAAGALVPVGPVDLRVVEVMPHPLSNKAAALEVAMARRVCRLNLRLMEATSEFMLVDS